MQPVLESKKGNVLVGVGVAAVVLMIVAVIAGKVYSAMPTDLTGTANASMYSIANDTLANLELSPLVILAIVAAILLGALISIGGGAGRRR